MSIINDSLTDCCPIIGVNKLTASSFNFTPSTSTKIITLSISTADINSNSILITLYGELLSFENSDLSGYFRITRLCNGSIISLSQDKSINIVLDTNPVVFTYQFFDDTLEDCLYKCCNCITYLIEFVSNLTTTSVSMNNLIITAKNTNYCNSVNCYTSNISSGVTNFRIENIDENNALIPIPIGSISLDTSNYTKPIVSLAFSGDLLYDTAFPPYSTFQFTVLRFCKNTSDLVYSNYIPNINLADNSLVFYYEFCDCDLACCKDCNITYVIYFTPDYVDPTTTDTIIINNVKISAYIFEKSQNNYKCTNGRAVLLTSNNSGEDFLVPTLELAHLTFTSEELEDNDILLTFTKNISLYLDGTSFSNIPATLGTLVLVKKYNNKEVILGAFYGISSPTITSNFTSVENDTSSFIFYDNTNSCDCCQGCITYSVRFQYGPLLFLESILNINGVVFSALLYPSKDDI